MNARIDIKKIYHLYLVTPSLHSFLMREMFCEQDTVLSFQTVAEMLVVIFLYAAMNLEQ